MRVCVCSCVRVCVCACVRVCARLCSVAFPFSCAHARAPISVCSPSLPSDRLDYDLVRPCCGVAGSERMYDPLFCLFFSVLRVVACDGRRVTHDASLLTSCACTTPRQGLRCQRRLPPRLFPRTPHAPQQPPWRWHRRCCCCSCCCSFASSVLSCCHLTLCLPPCIGFWPPMHWLQSSAPPSTQPASPTHHNTFAHV